MARDADRKRTLLQEWWRESLATQAIHVLGQGELLDKDSFLGHLGYLPTTLSVYILFAESAEEQVPVYIGKADVPLVRWGQHLDGWLAGTGPYARWRRALLDEEGRAREAMSLLVIPGTAITHPPIPDFPTTVGSVEYQLIALASDAYPDRLLNHEGKGR